MIIQSRRGFMTGLGASMLAAPAIVRATSLMPVRLFNATLTNRKCAGLVGKALT